MHALLLVNVENCNTFKNESVFALFVRLAMEFEKFDEGERGGLLAVGHYSGANILQRLVTNYFGTDNDFILRVMTQLKELGYLRKEDIKEHELLFYLFAERKHDGTFMENVFRFLVDWDPTALTELNRIGCTPLFYTPLYSIECFQSVFEAGIRYFPKKTGISLLFLQTGHSVASTAFEHACKKFGSDNVIDVIEKTLTEYYTPNDDANANKPYNTVDILLSTASDENLSLDGVYFLLRREPDILQKMLASSPTSTLTTKTKKSTEVVTGPNHNTHPSHDSDKDNNNNSSGVMISTIDSRKRKRK